MRAHHSHASDPMALKPRGDLGRRPVVGEAQADRETRFAIPLAAGRLHDVDVLAEGLAQSWSPGTRRASAS